MIADLKRIIESVSSNATAGSTLAAQDTESPTIVREGSSIANQPG